jgi:hypothetical protein
MPSLADGVLMKMGSDPSPCLENGEYEIPVPGAGWEKVLDWNPDKRG